MADAKPFDSCQSQSSAASARRELAEFYCGLMNPRNDSDWDHCDNGGVATVYSDCCNRRLRALIQMMETADAGRQPIIYCVSGDKQLEQLSGLAQTITKTRCERCAQCRR